MSAPYSTAYSMPAVLPPYGNAIGDFPLSSGTGGNTYQYETAYCTGGSSKRRTRRQMTMNRRKKHRTMGGIRRPGGGLSMKKRRHWSAKYKRSINCSKPKGFSQRQHCKYGRKK